ncbi:MAG: LytR C-terminal domain-containing protein [Endomicrobium sp.]|nr:LytR C-terminal domain-containing protein [Endomicrobium sp.]
MFQTLKKIGKIKVITICLFLIVFVVVYICVCKLDVVFRKIKDNDSFSFSVLLYDLDGAFADRFDSYQIIYDCKNKLLKILRVNTEAVVFKKKEKARSLKTLFYENVKKGLDSAVNKFYLDLYEVICNAASSDFYINMSFKTFNDMFGSDENIKSLLAVNKFENKDLELLSCLETIERVLCLLPYRFFKIQKNYKYINTNISKILLTALIFRIKKQKPIVMLCDMPVKYTRMRIEPNKQDIEEFLGKIYYNDVNINKKNVAIDIKNASGQFRMAEKVTWLLRANKFDVLDWGSFPIVYDVTLIKDYKGNFIQALKIFNILGVGKIIVSYNSSVYADMNVFIGKDCKIYDSFDKRWG